MQTYTIHIDERKRYPSGMPYHRKVTDAQGASRILYLKRKDIPQEMRFHLEDDRLHWVELDYPEDHGELTEHPLPDHGSFSLFLHDGLFSVLKPDPPPVHDAAYDMVNTCIERLVGIAGLQSDVAPGKWMTIFSVQLLAEQWQGGKPYLRRLFDGRKSHPLL